MRSPKQYLFPAKPDGGLGKMEKCRNQGKIDPKRSQNDPIRGKLRSKPGGRFPAFHNQLGEVAPGECLTVEGFGRILGESEPQTVAFAGFGALGSVAPMNNGES
jgi:hypothetical protein